MDRPADISRCYVCGQRLIAVDTYKGSKQDEKTKAWITRLFDIDWILSEHVRKAHQS